MISYCYLTPILKSKPFSGQKKLIMKQTKLQKNKMRPMKNQSQSPQRNITVQVEVVANQVAQTMIILVGKLTHWGKTQFFVH